MKYIDAEGMHYQELNSIIHEELEREKDITVTNVRGQRYIAAGVNKDVSITLEGIPGNDLGVFMSGPIINVKGNTQDGTGNTMSGGKIIIHGHGGDVLAYAMRGGEMYIKTNVGYRTGIHMKEYKEKIPCLIIGGRTGNFLGEYLAGGRIVVLGLEDSHEDIVGDYCGTGMHGGEIYLRGDVPSYKLSKEVKKRTLDEKDYEFLKEKINNYCKYFDTPFESVSLENFIKLTPTGSRPYGNLYAY